MGSQILQAQDRLFTEAETKDPSIVTRATSYGIGLANVFDNYLSPQSYHGWEVRLSRESVHATKWNPEKWSIQSYFQGYFDYTENRAENNNTMAGMANWNYGYYYKCWQQGGLQLYAGGVADLNGGFIYNLRNGNNPANMRVYVNMDASVRLLWKTHVKRFPLLVRYQVNVPLAGVMFAPHYGQSYFEIFTLGDSKGVVCMTTPFSQPSLRQMLSVDFNVKKTTLRLSYVCDLQQATANKVKSHLYSHVLMVGFVKHLKKL